MKLIKEDFIQKFTAYTAASKKTFSKVSASIVVNFKMKSVNMRFCQNFMLSIPHAVSTYNDKIILYANDIEDASGIVDGNTLIAKKIKKNYKWALEYSNIEKTKKDHYSCLNKKSILPNNIKDYSDINVTDTINKIRSGHLVKIYQLNNSFNASIGRIDTKAEEVYENLFSIIKFITQRGFMVSRIYIHHPMKKSFKL